MVGVLLVRHAEGIAVVHRAGDEGDAGHGRLAHRADVQPVGRGHRAHRRAVVGVPAGDDLVGARLVAALDLVLLGHLERGLDRLGAAADEEDAGEVARGLLGDPLGETDGRLGEVRDRADVVERAELNGDGLGDLGVAVAERVGPGVRGHHVEPGIALVVGQADAFAGLIDMKAAGADLIDRQERRDAVVPRILGEGGGFGRFGVRGDHGLCSVRVKAGAVWRHCSKISRGVEESRSRGVEESRSRGVEESRSRGVGARNRQPDAARD